jgi:hypothetical protein
MLVSRSEVAQFCSMIPTVGINTQQLVDSIFDKQHTLWFALTDSLQQGSALESLPDLSPNVEAGRATEATYRAAAANACRALSIQVLSSAIEEMAPTHIDVSRLRVTLNSVRTIVQCEPAITGSTAIDSDTTQSADGAETDEEETQSLCSDDEEVLQAEDAGPDWGAAPAEAAEAAAAAAAAAAEVVSVVANLGASGVPQARERRAREMIEAGRRQGTGCRLVLCPQDAHLDTVWIAAVSVAIFLLHAEGDRGQKMRECAEELDCIAKQNPTLLFFAVVCPDAEGYLNHNLWVGGAPNNVVLISFEELLGELAQDLSLPTKQFHYLLHNMTCPHGIELAVLTRHLLTACANFRGMLSRLKIGHLFFADTNDFFTRQAIQRMLVLQEPFVQLVDDVMEETNPARVLGGV